MPLLPTHTRALPQHLQLGDPYLIDNLHFMQDQEENAHYRRSGYLPASAKVTPSDRETMASWSFDIVDACSIDREVACIGMGYFDRFMSTSSHRAKAALKSRREFQLAFIACLIIALKGRAGMQVDSDFVADMICQSMYKQDELNMMELEILKALKWRLNGPSPHEFICGLVELMPVYARSNIKMVMQLRAMAKTRAEMAMQSYSMALKPSSAIAYAALVMSMRSIKLDAFHPFDRLDWMRNIALVTGIKTEHSIDSAAGIIGDVVQHKNIASEHTASTAPNTRCNSEQEFCSAISSTASSVRTEHDECDESVSMASSIQTQDESCDVETISTSWRGVAEIRS